ncbi:MAG: ZIP family metal transporter [Ignavibacteriales bacterium]|nr:ZIP family metal transporter [Ignavibacteriales bacterium]
MITALLFGLAAAGAEFLGGVIIAARREWPRRLQEVLLALGAGFILALVFLELIPHSIEAVGETAAFAMMAGFSVVHFFEHTVVGHLHFGEETHADVMVSKQAGLSAFGGLFIHAFFDGFSISAGVQFDMFLGLLIFLGILLHKFPEGLTIGSIMQSAGFSRNVVLWAAGGVGIGTILGVASVFLIAPLDESVVGLAFAFSAGVAMYVGASDLIPEINRSKNRIPPLVVFGGMLLFALTEMVLESLLK